MAQERRLRQLCKRLAYLLRHDPAAAGVRLDPGGWVAVDELMRGLAERGQPVGREEIASVVARGDKPRYELSADGRRIRARYGHSVAVDLGLEPAAPPPRLYHGTAERFVEAILTEGLRACGRQHVHLSEDARTARQVGARHGPPVVLAVDAAAMAADGAVFLHAATGVWLSAAVPPERLSVAGGG